MQAFLGGLLACLNALLGRIKLGRHFEEMRRRDNDLKRGLESANVFKSVWRDGQAVGVVHERKIVDRIGARRLISFVRSS